MKEEVNKSGQKYQSQQHSVCPPLLEGSIDQMTLVLSRDTTGWSQQVFEHNAVLGKLLTFCEDLFWPTNDVEAIFSQTDWANSGVFIADVTMVQT